MSSSIPSSNDTPLGEAYKALLAALGDQKVSLPDSIPYKSSTDSYFAQQNSELQPHCIVSPRTAQDVSTTIATITKIAAHFGFNYEDVEFPCPMAVRSGGHNSFGGASNIEKGITIDLSALDAIDVHPGDDIVSIGPGAKWGEVYSHIEPLNLGVAGGRVSQVGVGGLTLGGGISFFSPRYGWACDSLVEAEIVLPRGDVVIANSESYPELLIALRGGSSTLGIVTRLDFKLFKQGPIWGGNVYFPLETAEKQIKCFSKLSTESFDKLGNAQGYDEYASLIMSFGFSQGQGSAVVNSMVYSDISFKEKAEVPAVYKDFFEMPLLFNTVRVTGLTEIAKEQGAFSPNGRRQLSVVTTHDTSEVMLNATYQHWKNSLGDIQEVSGLSWSISLMPLPAAIYAKGANKNIMGLANVNKSLVVTLLSASWDNVEDDAKVEEAARALFAAIEDDARQLDAFHPYLYLNYAAPWQDPIASYGLDSVQQLQRVSCDVDPTGIFERMVPGGFKIPA